MALGIPKFRSSLMGFNKADVADYLARMESELETYVNRLSSVDKTMQTMKSDMQNLNQRLTTLTEENYQLEITNTQLRQAAYEFDEQKVSRDIHQKVLDENEALKEQIASLREEAVVPAQQQEEASRLRQENARLREQLAAVQEQYDATANLRQECESLRGQVAEAENQGKIVQEALISAQRMGRIVLSEAKEEADRLTTEARQAAEQTVNLAQKSASKTLEDARQRNEALQASYDRMLMDTSKMKAELIDLYRRHLALLAEIPGPGNIPVLEEAVLEAESE